MAFANLVFPTRPDSAKRMVVGSSCRMNFDGALNLEVDASYGLGDYKLSASSAANVIASIEKVVPAKITLPSAEVKPLGSASVKYAHTDQFGLVLEKQDANMALIYLMRSATNEFDEGADITVGVTTTDASVTLDAAQIQQTVQQVTGSATLAGLVGPAVAQEGNNLTTAALAKLNTWISDGKGNSAVSIALAQQTGRTLLFDYTVDLTQPAVAAQSWEDLLSRKIQDATRIPGFTLQAGSGVAEQLKRSTTLQFNFFNLYTYKDVTDFFDTWSSELAADGTIRLVSDTGIEELVSTSSATDTMRFHFTGTATEDVLGDVTKAEIDLNIEISEKNDPKGEAVLTNVLGIVSQNSLQPTIDAMNAYVTSNPGGTLSLVAVLKQTAYGKLPYAPYTPDIAGAPPANQFLDRVNWDLIHNNVIELKLGSAPIVSQLSYDDWSTWSIYTNNPHPGPDAVADRRHSAAPAALSPGSAVWHNYPPELVARCFSATAGGMNGFEDLVRLGDLLKSATTDGQWVLIQKDVVSIVNDDLDYDFSKPIAAAILKQAAAQPGVTVSASTAQAKDASTFTATITLA